jgi:hypothetical protein
LIVLMQAKSPKLLISEQKESPAVRGVKVRLLSWTCRAGDGRAPPQMTQFGHPGRRAGLHVPIRNHIFRAIAITAYLSN